MSNLNKLPVTTESSSSSSPQLPVKKTQGNHQMLFNSKPVPQPPIIVKENLKKQLQPQDPSVLVPTVSSTSLSAETEDEVLLDAVQQPQPSQTLPPPPAQQPQLPQQTHQRKGGRGKKNEEPTASKNRTNNNTNGGSAALKSVLKAIATGGLNIFEFVDKTDNKGTKWLKKEPTYKLSDIPTDAKHNEMEFINWVRMDRDFVIYQLYNAKGERYWATMAATRWLEAGALQGLTPANSSFMVKNLKDAGLIYGFRVKDSAVAAAATSTKDVD